MINDSLPPGKQADPYEQFQVLKPFSVTQEIIAPAFGQPGGGIQMRASIPEYEKGKMVAPISELLKHKYIGEK
jgi:hypothetical protein